jgi:hypothetical protein
MADDPSTPTTMTDDGAQAAPASPFSRFYADVDHRIADTTKSNVTAPSIRADLAAAQAGTDVVSDQEFTTLTGRDTHVYRSNPLGPEAADFKHVIAPLVTMIDRKAAGGPWTPADQQAEDQQIKAVATATGLDEDHVRSMAQNYETAAKERDAHLGQGFDHVPPTPLTEAIGASLARKALNQHLSPEEEATLQTNLQQYGRENHFHPGLEQDVAQDFILNARSEVNRSHFAAIDDIQKAVAATINGHGDAYVADSIERNHVEVPNIPGQGTRQTLAAWFVNPDDPPPNMPPGSKEMGEFLVSLHESEHLSRRGDQIAPKTLTPQAQEQAGEIDADKAVMAFLDNEHNTAAKNYWLQAREVDSFTSNVTQDTGSPDLGHDTATFLRTEQATGRQLDLDKFDTEKTNLLFRVQAKANLQATDPNYGRARVADVMGAVQAVLDDDKAEKNPANKLSPLQVSEAQQFLRDASAMGYQANPNFPRPGQGNNAPAAAAAPAQPVPAKPAGPAA